jgi:hypothetical protein
MSSSQEAVKRPTKKLSVVGAWPEGTPNTSADARALAILPWYPMEGKNAPLALAAKARACSTPATAVRRS